MVSRRSCVRAAEHVSTRAQLSRMETQPIIACHDADTWPKCAVLGMVELVISVSLQCHLARDF